MTSSFSVVLFCESRREHEQLSQILAKSVRDFTIVEHEEELIRRAHERAISVVLFGFKSIEKSEVAYFRLLKTDSRIEDHFGSSILLCSKPEIKQAFQLCRKGLFDDYYTSIPLYDPYHLLLRFRQLKADQDGSTGKAKLSPDSLSVVCESLEQIAHADARISGINVEMLQKLGETIQRAMASLSEMLETQLGAQGEQAGKATELISRHSDELVNKPITSDVSAAVDRVREVSREVSSAALDQRVALGRAHPEMAPRSKRVIVIEDNVAAAEALEALLQKNQCSTVVYHYGRDFARDMDKLSADIVMLDLTLPDMPAFHLVKKVRSTPGLTAARLFVMAQSGDREKVELVLGMGVDEVLVKPVDEHMMAFKLSNY